MNKDTSKKNTGTEKDALVVALCGAIPANGEIPETSRKFVEEGLKMALADAGVTGKVVLGDIPAGVEAEFDYGIADCNGYTADVSVDVAVTRTGIVVEASVDYRHGAGFRREEIGTFGGFMDVVYRLCHGALVDAIEADIAWEKKNLEYVRGKLSSGKFDK